MTLAIGAALVVTVLFGSPVKTRTIFAPTDPLDSSWHWALYQAAQQHLQFGSQFVFTFGPWGFLNFPNHAENETLWLLATGTKWIAELLFLLLVGSMAWHSTRLRRASRVELMAFAVPSAIIVLGVLHQNPFYLLTVDGLLLAVGVMRPDMPPRSTALGVVAMSAVLALVALIQVSMVVFTTFAVLCAAATVARRSGEKTKQVLEVFLGFLGTFIVFLLFWWGLASQDPLGIFGYLGGSWQIVTGFEGAMSLGGKQAGIVVVVVLAAITAFLLATPCLWMVFRSDLRIPHSKNERAQTLWTVVLLAGFIFTSWKEVVIRLRGGSGYFDPIVSAIGIAVLVLVSTAPQRTIRRPPGIVNAGLVALAALLLTPSLFSQSQPQQGLRATTGGLRLAVDPASYVQSVDNALSHVRKAYGVPRSMITQIGNAPVAILPSSLTIGPAYQLRQTLLPVPQLYQAYTPWLDHLDANYLHSHRTPYVLLEYTDIDGRYPLWSAPATYDYLLANYQIAQRSSQYVLFRHSSGPVRTSYFSTAPIRIGAWTRVPQCTNGSMIGTFGMHLSSFSRVREVLYRDPEVQVRFRVDGRVTGPFRFVWALAPDGLLLSSYYSSALQLSSLGASNDPSTAISAFEVLAPPGMFATSGHDVAKVSFSCLVASPR